MDSRFICTSLLGKIRSRWVTEVSIENLERLHSVRRSLQEDLEARCDCEYAHMVGIEKRPQVGMAPPTNSWGWGLLQIEFGYRVDVLNLRHYLIRGPT